MKIKIIIILCLVAALVGCADKTDNSPAAAQTKPTPAAIMPTSAPAVSDSYTPVFEWAECPFTLPQGFVEDENVACGYLTVPENRSAPSGRQIQIAVAYFDSLNPNPTTTPVVYIEGGPGASALEPLHLVIEKFMPLLQNHDVIFYDQRGVGRSQPALDCPAFEDLSKLMLENHFTGEENRSNILTAAGDCRQHFTDQGFDLSMYNTRQSAADLEDLRIALRIGGWSLYGVSYGTKIALETMHLYPDGIVSVVLDSPVPLEADPITEAADNMDQALTAVFEACQQDADCSQAYPDLENKFYGIAAQLDESPIQLPVTNLLTGEQFNSVLDGAGFISIVVQSLYSAETIPMLPLVMHETASGNLSKLSLLRSNFLSSAGFLSTGMLHTVRCNEEVSFTTPEKIAAALEKHPQFKSMTNASATNGMVIFDLCAELDAGTAVPDQNQPVNSPIPALVLNGKFDPATPPRWGRQVAGQLQNSYYFEFEAVGHGPSLSHPCPNSMALAFLADPSQAPDTTCMADMNLSFMLPANLEDLTFITAEVPEYGIQAALPNGWYAIKPEYYVSTDHTIELVIAENREESIEEFKSKWHAGELLNIPTYNDIAWQVYPFNLPQKNVGGYMAVSESAQGFYLVLVVGTEIIQTELYKYIFLPVLESYTLSK